MGSQGRGIHCQYLVYDLGSDPPWSPFRKIYGVG